MYYTKDKGLGESLEFDLCCFQGHGELLYLWVNILAYLWLHSVRVCKLGNPVMVRSKIFLLNYEVRDSIIMCQKIKN